MAVAKVYPEPEKLKRSGSSLKIKKHVLRLVSLEQKQYHVGNLKMKKALIIAAAFAAIAGPAMAMSAMDAAYQAAREGPPALNVCAKGWGDRKAKM
jgi:hypothetical protein